jgi:hypothetical protein
MALPYAVGGMLLTAQKLYVLGRLEVVPYIGRFAAKS